MKINPENIQGFSEMSAEDKISALLGLDIPDPVDLSGYVKKEAFDKKASEAAEYSRQLKSKMTDEEAEKAEQQRKMVEVQQELSETQKKYADLLRESTIAKHTSRFQAIPGYDQKLAQAAAVALVDGDSEKLFEIQQQAAEAIEKTMRAERVSQDPKPTGTVKKSDGSTNPLLEIATAMGKQKAESAAAASEGLKKFMLK